MFIITFGEMLTMIFTGFYKKGPPYYGRPLPIKQIKSKLIFPNIYTRWLN